MSAFEDIKAQRFDTEDLPATPDPVSKTKEEAESPIAQQRFGLVIEEHSIESESEDLDALLRPRSEW